MQFMIYALDKPDSLELRMQTREAHLEYVRGSGKMEFGKPLVDDGDMMIGSIIIINVADRAEAEDFAANDPYQKAGLFQNVTIKRIKTS